MDRLYFLPKMDVRICAESYQHLCCEIEIIVNKYLLIFWGSIVGKLDLVRLRTSIFIGCKLSPGCFHDYGVASDRDRGDSPGHWVRGVLFSAT